MSNRSFRQLIIVAIPIIAIIIVSVLYINNIYSDVPDGNDSEYVYTDAQDGIRIVSVTIEQEEIKIPDKIDGKTVTEIGESVFENNEAIKKVVLPKGLLKIGQRAFANCTNLKEVVFNQKITEIDHEAFSNCSSLVKCVIPVSGIQIEETAFDKDTEVSIDTPMVSDVESDYETSANETDTSDESEQETSIPEEISQNDVSQDDESQYEESQAEVSQDEESQGNESQGNESEVEETPNDVSQTEEDEDEEDRIGEDDFVMMYQSDSKYSSHPYGDYTVGSHGCGPACMATIIKNFKGADVTPITMADWSFENGYYAGASGSYHALITAAAKKWGVKCSVTYTFDKDMIQEKLENGEMLLVIMGPGEFTTKGHYLLLRGLTDSGKVQIGDTQSPKNTAKLWDLDFLYSELKVGSPIWIFEQ